ncbi:MAG: AAA family ATPase [Bacteroidaceae bacterium]|nr:AAA family ATPase [Bacteroidaceae bacterium]
MKKITKIKIDNYKAYVKEQTIELKNGRNLLLYGENGSGKSSLYHALHHFLRSSVEPSKQFDLNLYSGQPSGRIEVTFQEYDDATGALIPATQNTYIATENAANNTNAVQFLNLGYRVSGFLDYAKLLKVYLNKGNRPNLFALIMELLREYIPINQGLICPITEIYDKVNREIGLNYHRSDYSYQDLKTKSNSLIVAFPDIINDLNGELTRMLSTYFGNFNLRIQLVGANMFLNEDGYIRDAKIVGKVYLDVQHYGQPMVNYNQTLNEARLSAIAICLYLATLKLRTSNVDTKILYLDDVFVGLDSSNRRPVIQMLLNEFRDYQILVSTYDKSWYLLAREIINDDIHWSYQELYEGQTTVAGKIVSKPILVDGLSDIDMARKHLYDAERPDYPAAANYMRKAYEEMLSSKLFRPALLDKELEPIASFRIGPMLKRYLSFLDSISGDRYVEDIKLQILQLQSHLKPMLHPLSHYAPDNPIYKNELMEAERLYDTLSQKLDVADYKTRCKVVVPMGGLLMFRIHGTGWIMEYLFELEDHLISYEDVAGNRCLTKTPMHIVEFSKFVLGKSKQTLYVNEKMHLFNTMRYIGVDDCVLKLSTFLATPLGGSLPGINVLANHTDMFFCADIVAAPQPSIVYNKVLTEEM